MAYADLDIDLSDDEIAARDMARRFATEVARPKGIALDRLHDPAEVIARGSQLWDVYRTYRELGLHSRGMPRDLGGQAGSLSSLANFLINEQLGYGDAGIAISLGAAGSPFAYAAMAEDDEIRGWARDYVNDMSGEITGCWAITEPDHGTDWVNAADPQEGQRKFAPQVRAEKRGKEYILNGQKSAWVSNGTIASHASLHVSLDPERGMHGTGVCVLPLDLPGIRRGKPLDKIGQRALNQGEIFFDEVVIPEKYMVANWTFTQPTRRARGGGDPNTGMSVTFAGLALAAFDEALQYARERIQGGVAIIEHQNIKLKLMRMFQQVEAARSLSRRTYLYNTSHTPGSSAHAASAKSMSTETAFQVASEAIQIHGGNGLSREYGIEKIFRDARASMIEDGVNESLLMAAAANL